MEDASPITQARTQWKFCLGSAGVMFCRWGVGPRGNSERGKIRWYPPSYYPVAPTMLLRSVVFRLNPPSLLCALSYVTETRVCFCGRAQETPPLHGGPQFWVDRLSYYVSTRHKWHAQCGIGVRSSVRFLLERR